jgi:hypothetical protein
MAIVIPDNIPNRTKWCQICGRYNASPADPTLLRPLLAAKGVADSENKLGQAHFSCLKDLQAEVEGG